MQSEKKITRSNILELLKRFATEYRKELGKIPGEIIIVGGGSIMLNYRFREATEDLDVILRTTSDIDAVIKKFADDNSLPSDWMNTSFKKTDSYSHVLPEVSEHCCTLNNGTFEIRTISGVYLIAMKLRARREYRNDISDAIGIIKEEKKQGNDISLEEIQEAYTKLYQESLPDDLKELISSICCMTAEEIEEYYNSRISSENTIGGKITTYIKDGVDVNTRNVDDVIARIKKKLE